ncbi:hypothetical protein, partial [Streptomyces sp. NRRL F-5126]|uniref:hypothetical protein n=1 Tax=Streptomyces sp. NRRL F-5126 TaxID=1463857 RepID=UPI00056607F6
DTLTTRPLPTEQLTDTTKTIRNSLFHIEWTTLPPTAPLAQDAAPASETDAIWAWLDTEHFPATPQTDETAAGTGASAPRFHSISALAEAVDNATPNAVLLSCVFQPLTTMTELHQATHHLLALLQEWLT